MRLGWLLLALLLKLTIILPDLTFKNLIGPKNNSLINYTLGFTIYLGTNTVITIGPFSHKSRLIYHFRIAHY